MAYYDDDDDDYGGRRGSSRSSSRDRDRSRSNGSEKGNELFGGLITLPGSLTPMANLLKDTIRPYIVEKGEGFVKGGLEKALPKIGLSRFAPGIASGAASVFAYALIFSDQLAGSYRNAIRYFSGRKQLAEDLSSVIKAEGAKDMLSGLLNDSLKNNEVVLVAKGQLKDKWGQDTATDLTGLLSALPTWYLRYNNVKRERGEAVLKDASDTIIRQENEAFAKDYKNLCDQGLPENVAANRASSNSDLRRKARSKSISGHVDDEQSETFQKFIVPAGAAAAEGLRGHFVGKEKKASGKSTALEMILKLSETVINDKDATGVNGVPFNAYIRKIFDTHQENMDQPKIGKRFEEKIEFACKEIADSITKGKMHPMALVRLVGDREIVKEKGKKIALREEVKSAVARWVEKMPARFAVDPDEYLSESPVGEEKYKARLNELQGDAKDFYIATMPPEVAKKIGSKEEEIEAAQKKYKNGALAHDLSRAVLDLGTLPDEKLKAAGQTEKEIALVRKLAPAAKEGRRDEIMAAVGTKGEFKGTLDTMVAAGMAAGLIGRPGELYEKAGGKLFGEEEVKKAPPETPHKRHKIERDDDRKETPDFSEEEESDMPDTPSHMVSDSRHLGMKNTSASAAEHGFGAA